MIFDNWLDVFFTKPEAGNVPVIKVVLRMTHQLRGLAYLPNINLLSLYFILTTVSADLVGTRVLGPLHLLRNSQLIMGSRTWKCIEAWRNIDQYNVIWMEKGRLFVIKSYFASNSHTKRSLKHTKKVFEIPYTNYQKHSANT